jgi:hypothetical protein
MRMTEPAPVMEAPASIIRDPERLKSLSRTGLLDTPPSDSFDILTRVAAALLGAPVALVSLVDDKRQFFKSHVGLPEPWATRRQTPLTHSFCQWVVSDHDALVVDDARTHPVLRDNRALHELGVIAYAGIPLTPTTGDPIGSFCAVDTKPREWSSEEFNTWERAAQHGKAPGDINRFPVLRAIGGGIPPLAKILRRDDPHLGEAERQSLLTLMEWMGEQLARVAGAA